MEVHSFSHDSTHWVSLRTLIDGVVMRDALKLLLIETVGIPRLVDRENAGLFARRPAFRSLSADRPGESLGILDMM